MPANPSAQTARARALRRTPTDAERRLWSLLRGRRLAGWKFHRGAPFGPYFLDFYCHEVKLAIEADRGHHFGEPDQVAHDKRRDAFLATRGLTMLRLPDRDILLHTEGAAETIVAALEARRPGTGRARD